MKKVFYVVVSVLLAVSIIGGGIYTFSDQDRTHSHIAEVTPVKSEKKSHALVIYFAGDKDLEKMAEDISEKTDGDLLKVTAIGKNVTEDPNKTKSLIYKFTKYSSAEEVQDKTDYDVIYVGYPSSWKANAKRLKMLQKNIGYDNEDIIPFGVTKLKTVKTTRKSSQLTDDVQRCVC